jgi:hypothetical protein
MLRVAYWIVLSMLVLTFLAVFLVFASFESFHLGPVTLGYGGPFETFYVSNRTYVDRAAAGYTKLPRYYPPRYGGAADPGGFAAWNETTGFEPWTSGAGAVPLWPEGDPGLGARNPLPPLVKRVWRRNVPSEHVFAVIGTVTLGWVGIGVLRWWLRGRNRPFGGRRGFDVAVHS